MQPILTRLKEAQNLMPKAMPRATSGAMILTLLVWKCLSDAWQHRPTPSHSTPATLASTLQFHPDCLFSACHSPDLRQFGNAIRTSLYGWMAAQPDHALNDILLPERFGYQSEFAAQLFATPVLASLMTILGAIRYQPKMPLGPLVERAMLQLGLQEDGAPPRLAQLAAQLVQVFPHETILDPLCGQGDLLMACATQLAQTTQSAGEPVQASLNLYGQDPNPEQLALAKLRLLAHGYPPANLSRGRFLDAPLTMPPLQALRSADIVLSAIGPDSATAAHVARSTPERLPAAAGIFAQRFPHGLPETPELAHIWHAIACARPHNARIALIVPASVLADTRAQPLVQYLLRNGLSAVIDLPPSLLPWRQDGALLLLICIKQAQRRHVSFIVPAQSNPNQSGSTNAPIAADPDADLTRDPDLQPDIHADIHSDIQPDIQPDLSQPDYPARYDAKTILHAWYAIQSRHSHPNVRTISHSSIAHQQYSLNWRDYPAANQQPLDNL
jgi:hypothetical protein